MEEYRYGYKENIIGSSWYCIEKRNWLGMWVEKYTFRYKENMKDVVNQLKEKNNTIVIKMN